MSDVQSYALIGLHVLTDTRLSGDEKILYTHIVHLSGVKPCVATNAFFASVFNVSTRTIQRQLEHLRNLGYIRVIPMLTRRVIIPLVPMSEDGE